jgi:hypothetical protein
LHAFNHNAYQILNQDPERDIWALLDLMGGLQGVPWHRTWRPPYGGDLTFEDEERIAARLGLKHRKWSIDSNDWQYHADALGALVPEWLWPVVVKQSLSARILAPTWVSDKWLDILLHVNGRTSSHLGEILRMVEEGFNTWYGGGSSAFGPGGRFCWHTKDDAATLSDYLGC